MSTAPPLPAGAVALLACPVCGAGLTAQPDDAACAARPGHRFDRARQGHVTLLPPGHRPPSGDSARDGRRPCRVPRRRPLRRRDARRWPTPWADGEPRHPARPRRRHRPPPGRRPGRAAGRRRHRAGLLARTRPAGPPGPIRGPWPWSPTPGRGCRCRTRAVDRVLVVFAPRNGPEIARVLRPGRPARRRHAGARPPARAGRPARTAAGRPGQAGAAGGHAGAAPGAGRAVAHRELLRLDRAAVAMLVGMGPHARHLARDDVPAGAGGAPGAGGGDRLRRSSSLRAWGP